MTLADKMKMLGIDHDESKNENRSESTQILSMKQNATGDGGMQNTTQYRLNNKQDLRVPSSADKMNSINKYYRHSISTRKPLKITLINFYRSWEENLNIGMGKTFLIFKRIIFRVFSLFNRHTNCFASLK